MMIKRQMALTSLRRCPLSTDPHKDKPSSTQTVSVDEKLQKVLANQGFASRREIERWISAGRIKVNDEIASLGARVTADDKISVDGRFVIRKNQTPTRVLMLNKPIDYVCTTLDPQERQTVYSLLPKLHHERWIGIGRLDINSSGLLLFSNNGELANRFMHPKYELEREYAVRVLGQVKDETLTELKSGVELDDGQANFANILDAGGAGANHWYHVTLKEGRNREVRRLWEAVGHKVSRLHRIRYGPIELGRSVKPGRYQELDHATINTLLTFVGLPKQAEQDSQKGQKNLKRQERQEKVQGKPRKLHPSKSHNSRAKRR